MGEKRSALHHVGAQAALNLDLRPEEVAVITPPSTLPGWRSSLPVGELAMDSVAIASLAINMVAAHRSHAPQVTPVNVSAPRVAASFGSERLFRINDEPPTIWSPLSGFWRTSDGWVRTHGNYPHHAERLRALLDLGQSPEKADVTRAIEQWTSANLEEQAQNYGALVTAVRDAASWREHPHARALAGTPLIPRRMIDNAGPRPWPRAGGLPLTGIRVLDLTRVIAGPVATRDLAHAGADVLRVDSPLLPEAAWQHFDTGQGKRSTLLDLRQRPDRNDFYRLLRSADVIVLGYRPGALARFGLDFDTLCSERPGLVVAEISAWGTTGPWSHRRGFDSLVQAATGIAITESTDGGKTPGALPVQALDHSAGHFLAAAVAIALRQQRSTGGSIHVSTNLARIAQELLSAVPVNRTDRSEDAIALPTVTEQMSAPAHEHPMTMTSAPPVLAFAGASVRYANTGRTWGADSPEWSTQDDGAPACNL